MNFNKQISDRFELEKQDESADAFGFADLVERLTGFVRRQYPIFVFIIACALALGLVYLITTPAKYTSHAMLLIDSSKLRILQQEAPLGDIPIDTAQVETQVEILKSENIGLSVIKDLKLTDDPEFVGSGHGLIGTILGFLSSPFGFLAKPNDASDTKLVRHVLATFLSNRAVTRVSRTYVLDIAYTSLKPDRAATIANAIADAYIVDQLEAKYQTTRRASVWLQDRIKELRKQATDADRAVLDYKEKNNIVAVGGAANGGTRLLGEQQLEQLNSELGSARAAAEEAKARLERINEVMKKDVPDATVTDTLHSEVINRLRNQYLDIAAKEAIWSARYGSTHLAVVNLRTQMAELRRAIIDELGRIAQSYKSDYEIAKSRVDGLEKNLQTLVADSQITNRDKLGLRDLESTAQVYHTLYDNFLQRYMEAIQQQSFPITEARVISPAAPPQHKSGPVAFKVLGIAGAIGLMLSFGAALLREAVDRVFRTPLQVETNLQARCLAVLPMLASKKTSKIKGSIVRAMSPKGSGDETVPVISPSAAGSIDTGLDDREIQDAALTRASQLTQSELIRNLTNGDVPPSGNSLAKLPVASNRPFMRWVIDEPLSAFAEAFRSIKVAADISESRVIGITSTVPAEGKSTVSSNLAQLMAHAGKRVILLDGDLRNPSLSRALTPSSKAGLLEVLAGQTTLDDAVHVDEATGLRFLPAVVNSSFSHTNEILGSSVFKKFLDELRKTHDYVIIDLSPIAPVVDVRATTQIMDSYVYVIEWGRTQRNLVQAQLSAFPELQDRLLGVVLNKADVRVLGRYETYYGKQDYKNYYGQSASPA
ncbi:MAG: polysaccharide biosynthesis tyrosine autokinase [Bradyrhizobium sp.]|uniref:polysaccharide biosynthesis tyrosine autokinase n=1 Tax=Bradyrhizobium sp. TaxID=376 RepID=UPI001C29C722|nr:polysaccharide biosynthesis tyrosine autokinase [Bradyrhizobium sp.]MBU6461126.1 polysaccharide biosynthesis tyrosine autokinase [Pseudomonadota bacterium]MDE2066202.1 polysaccharide biosynthesis tyrosine autokinase [Bradyrhizobium sp.]MDE2472642.1 polysaccharide biosynthesis tyrosine autokinase [Bradyrhizobium sp.]